MNYKACEAAFCAFLQEITKKHAAIKAERHRRVRQLDKEYIIMWIVLFLFWIILNGKATPEVVFLGIPVSSAVYLFLYQFMNLSPKRERVVFKSLWGAVKYLVFLTIEVIKANLATARMILNFEEEPEPVLVKFDSKLQTGTGNTALANSITLTPGTITVDVDHQNGFLVHALDKSFAEGIDNCDFVKKLTAMENKAVEDSKK